MMLSGLVTYIKTTNTKRDFNEIFYLNLQNEYRKCNKVQRVANDVLYRMRFSTQ